MLVNARLALWVTGGHSTLRVSISERVKWPALMMEEIWPGPE